jgi:hypothetical protein
MSLPSMTSHALRILRADEERRLFKINAIVQSIYPQVLDTAKYTGEKAYHHEIKFADRVFYTTNMTAILAGLKELFPDAHISHTLLSYGTDGKLYDIARIKDDTLRLVSKANNNSYIVVDWSYASYASYAY